MSNVRSAAQLAASAGAAAGLRVRHLVETTTPVSADAFRQRMEQLAADDEVHAVVAIVLPTGATGDLEAAILQASTGKPLAAVVLTQPESVRLIDNRIPAYGSPEAAVRALARAAGDGAWRAAPRGTVPDLPDVRTADARALIQDSAPGWLGPAQAAELLRCYGIALADPAPSRVRGWWCGWPVTACSARWSGWKREIHTERPGLHPSPTSTPPT